MNSKLHDKELELVQTREDTRELGGKIGQMYHTPKYDTEHYSSAKLDGWEKQLEKLQGKEQSILEEITAIKHDPEFIKDLEAKNLALANRVYKLSTELVKVQSQLAYKPGEAAEKIIEGADPLKAAAEYKGLQDRIELIKLSLEHCGIASKLLDTMGEDVPYQPAHAESWPQGQKFEVPRAEMPHVRMS